MNSLSASLTDLLSAPAITPRVLVDLHTAHGTYHWSTDAFAWGDVRYEPRIQRIGDLVTQLGAPGIVAPANISFTVPNADGWCSTKPPDFFQSRSVTIRGVLLENTSEAVWTFQFRTTGAAMTSPTEFEIQAEDLLAEVRRRLVPSPGIAITRDEFPAIPDDSPGLGKPVPILQGRAMVPMYLVEEGRAGETGAGAIFTVCLGGGLPGPDIVGAGAVTFNGAYQLFEGELVMVQSAETFQESHWGRPIQMVRQASSPRIGGAIAPHFAHISHNFAGSQPGNVLENWLLLPEMVGMRLSAIDDNNFTEANSYFQATPIGFIAMGSLVTEFQPFESLVDGWAYDAMAHLSARDKIRLTVQRSRSAVASFHAGNIVAGSLRFRDVPLGERASTQRINFRNTFDDRLSPGTVVAEESPKSIVSFIAESGTAEQARVSEHIPAQRMAAFVAERWAKREAAASRAYAWATGVYGVHIEEGDIVTLTHSLLNGTRTVEVVGVSRHATGATLSARETNVSVFATGVLSSAFVVASMTRAQYIGYSQAAANLNPGVVLPITSSHGLANLTPSRVTAKWNTEMLRTLSTASYDTSVSNNSQFTVRLSLVTGATSVNLSAGGLDGFMVRA